MNPVALVSDLLQLIPLQVRRVIYGVFVLAVVIQGALAVWYDDPDPEWVRKSGDVLQYLGVGVGLTALVNARHHGRPARRPGRHEAGVPGEGGYASDPVHTIGVAVLYGMALLLLVAAVRHATGV